jgi:hypothetical protein
MLGLILATCFTGFIFVSAVNISTVLSSFGSCSRALRPGSRYPLSSGNPRTFTDPRSVNLFQHASDADQVVAENLFCNIE